MNLRNMLNGSILIYADSNYLDFKLMRLATDFCKKVGSDFLPIFISNKSDYEFEDMLIANDVPHENYLLINSIQATCQLTKKNKIPEFQNVIAIFHTTKE